jgi:hypothetical protein
LVTVTGAPENGGTDARRNAAAMQPPTGVPANGGPAITACVTRPLVEKVTCTLATPFGPSSFAQPAAAPAADASAPRAASLLNSSDPDAGSATVGTTGAVEVGPAFIVGSAFAVEVGSAFAVEVGSAFAVEVGSAFAVEVGTVGGSGREVSSAFAVGSTFTVAVGSAFATGSAVAVGVAVGVGSSTAVAEGLGSVATEAVPGGSSVTGVGSRVAVIAGSVVVTGIAAGATGAAGSTVERNTKNTAMVAAIPPTKKSTGERLDEVFGASVTAVAGAMEPTRGASKGGGPGGKEESTASGSERSSLLGGGGGGGAPGATGATGSGSGVCHRGPAAAPRSQSMAAELSAGGATGSLPRLSRSSRFTRELASGAGFGSPPSTDSGNPDDGGPSLSGTSETGGSSSSAVLIVGSGVLTVGSATGGSPDDGGASSMSRSSTTSPLGGISSADSSMLASRGGRTGNGTLGAGAGTGSNDTPSPGWVLLRSGLGRGARLAAPPATPPKIGNANGAGLAAAGGGPRWTVGSSSQFISLEEAEVRGATRVVATCSLGVAVSPERSSGASRLMGPWASSTGAGGGVEAEGSTVPSAVRTALHFRQWYLTTRPRILSSEVWKLAPHAWQRIFMARPPTITHL